VQQLLELQMQGESIFLLVTIPVMLLLGIRHALDVDHVTAIDNLVRIHNLVKRARWIGSSFSLGHMLSVSLEMIALIYVVKSLEAESSLQFWGGITGAVALATIGGANLYSMKRYSRTGSAILATRVSRGTKFTGPGVRPLPRVSSSGWDLTRRRRYPH